MAYTKTTWVNGGAPGISADKLNNIENGIDALHNGIITPDQTQVPANPGSGTLFNLFNWFANRIKAITGKTNWYDTPSKTLEDLNSHINNTNNPHNVTAAQIGYTASDVLAKLKTVDGAGSGLDADTIDGLHASYFINTSNIAFGSVYCAQGASQNVNLGWQPRFLISIIKGTTGTYQEVFILNILYAPNGNYGLSLTSTGFQIINPSQNITVYYYAVQ